MKISDDLKATLESLKNEAIELSKNETATVEEIEAKREEIKNLKAKISLQEELEAKEVNQVVTSSNKIGGEKMNVKDIINKVNNKEELAKEEVSYLAKSQKKAFLNAIRGKASNEDIEVLDALSETGGTPEGSNGGYVVPQDIQTQINEYKRSLPDLTAYINTESVGTLSGSRVYEKIATMTSLANITDDTADIEDMGNPTFETVTYSVKDYAGFMPIPNDLLNDSDQALEAYLVKWIGRKSVVTRNSLIIAILTALTPVTFADWKGVKKALNVTLDPIFKASARIITNQDGYQYFDTLVDGQNRPLLQPDATRDGGSLLFGKQLEVIPNTVLATSGNYAPVFVGNLQEAITMFERQGIVIDSTNIGGTAFRKNRTELRAIEREDIKSIDTDAVVYGKINVSSVVSL